MGILIMNFMFIGELLVPSFHNYLVFANKTSKLEKFVALSQYACVCLNMHVLVCSCRVIFGRRGNLMSTSIHAGYTYHLIASIHMNFLLPKLWLTESYFFANMTSLTIDALEIWLCEDHYTHSLSDGRDCTWRNPARWQADALGWPMLRPLRSQSSGIFSYQIDHKVAPVTQEQKEDPLFQFSCQLPAAVHQSESG
jgi:hypothetical protein